MELEKKIEFLYKAIEDTQNSIRFGDTKAGFILVGLTVISSYLSGYVNTLWQLMSYKLNFGVLIAILAGILTLTLFVLSGLTSFKAINPLSSPVEHIISEGGSPKILFYLWEIKPRMSFRDLLIERCDSKINYKVSELEQAYSAAGCEDIIESLTFELAKVAYIREKKLFRVSKAVTLFQWGIVFWLISMVLFKLLTIYVSK